MLSDATIRNLSESVSALVEQVQELRAEVVKRDEPAETGLRESTVRENITDELEILLFNRYRSLVAYDCEPDFKRDKDFAQNIMELVLNNLPSSVRPEAESILNQPYFE